MNTSMQDLREDILTSVLLSTQTKTIVCAFIDNHLEKEKENLIEFVLNYRKWFNQNVINGVHKGTFFIEGRTYFPESEVIKHYIKTELK